MKPASLLCVLGLALAFAAPASAQINMTEVGFLEPNPLNDKNDLWGYETGDTAIAIVGTVTGTSFIDVSNPASPVEVAFFPGPNSLWRDMKTYSTYAYVVNDEYGFGGNGLRIFDLSDPLNPVLVKNETTWFDTAHNLYVDEATGYLYASGTDAPGTVVLDLADPENPTLVVNWQVKYVHDLYVENGYAYLATINDGELTIADVSSLPSVVTRSEIVTPNAFTHNTWLTSDGTHCLTTDEKSTGHIGIYDVTDPDDPVLVSEFLNPVDPNSIVHNVTVQGDFAYVAWYRSGLHVLDVSDPRFPQQVGRFDTSPLSGSGFNGAWGVYPYAPSGLVYVSDIESGLRLLSFTPDFGRVAGLVTDANTTATIAGATCTIVAENNTVTSWTDGFYRFSLPYGGYTVQVSAFGYEPDSLFVSVVDTSTVNGDISLVPLPTSVVRGYVGEIGSYQPLAGILVTLNGTPLSTVTDASGHYVFPQVPVGSYSVTIDEHGYSPRSDYITVVEGADTVVDFTLVPAVFADDFETDQGWTVGAPGDAATTGVWEREDPEGTAGGTVQPEDDHTRDPGVTCYVTGAFGPTIAENDVDGGATSLISPTIDLTGVSSPMLRYWRWYTNNAGANPNIDDWEAWISNDDGANWILLEGTSLTTADWLARTYNISLFVPPTDQMRVKFVAADIGGGSIVEAAVDDVMIYGTAATVDVPADDPRLPRVTRLLPAAPNPMRANATVRFSLDERQEIDLAVYDALGRRMAEVAVGVLDGGDHEFTWDGTGRGGRLASGVYFLRLRHAGGEQTRKLVLAR